MFRYADITGDGMVSYEEFERVVHQHEAEQHTLRELFDALDTSGTGVLTADDLTAFLEMNGPHPRQYRLTMVRPFQFIIAANRMCLQSIVLAASLKRLCRRWSLHI